MEPASLERLASERIDELVRERAAARKARDFARADAIRNSLAESGVALRDTPNGTEWHYMD